jgi:hypothetical protein
MRNETACPTEHQRCNRILPPLKAVGKLKRAATKKIVAGSEELKLL